MMPGRSTSAAGLPAGRSSSGKKHSSAREQSSICHDALLVITSLYRLLKEGCNVKPLARPLMTALEVGGTSVSLPRTFPLAPSAACYAAACQTAPVSGRYHTVVHTRGQRASTEERSHDGHTLAPMQAYLRMRLSRVALKQCQPCWLLALQQPISMPSFSTPFLPISPLWLYVIAYLPHRLLKPSLQRLRLGGP